MAAAFLRDFTIQKYNVSQERAQTLDSRDRPTVIVESNVRSWHITRLHLARLPTVQEAPGCRELTGEGGFGAVYKSADSATGNPLAVKVIRLKGDPHRELTINSLHREIKALENLRHVSRSPDSQPRALYPLCTRRKAG